MYGTVTWGTARDSNWMIIQLFQNKVLRTVTNAPWYARNEDIHTH